MNVLNLLKGNNKQEKIFRLKRKPRNFRKIPDRVLGLKIFGPGSGFENFRAGFRVLNFLCGFRAGFRVSF